MRRVPAVMQHVKNLNAVAWVVAEALVGSLAWCRGLKDPALLQLRLRSSCRLDLIPGLGTSICHECGHLKKRVLCVLREVLKRGSQQCFQQRQWNNHGISDVMSFFFFWSFCHFLSRSRGKEVPRLGVSLEL